MAGFLDGSFTVEQFEKWERKTYMNENFVSETLNQIVDERVFSITFPIERHVHSKILDEIYPITRIMRMNMAGGKNVEDSRNENESNEEYKGEEAHLNDSRLSHFTSFNGVS